MTDQPGFGDFVGREGEMAALLDGLNDAVGGRGRLFLVGGEPGIGKSRLIDEFAARARAQGARVTSGRCWEAGGAPPFWPWMECLRSLIRGTDPSALRSQLGPRTSDLAPLLPELADAADVHTPSDSDPESARFRLFDATMVFLRDATADRPLVLILDDLQAADAPSLLLLRFLAQRLESARLVVLAAYRDTDLTGEVSSALAEVSREASSVRLSLGGLEEDQVVRLVQGVTAHQAGPEAGRAIHRGTEGNPLFVGELVRLLEGEGRLDRLDGEAFSTAIPEGIRAVIGKRLARLSSGCIELLQSASVVGREFGVEVLERLDRAARRDVVRALDEATSARILTEVPGSPGTLRFSHALIRETLYQDVPPGRRGDLHRRVAETLEGLYGADPGPMLAELAHHYFEAAPGGTAAPAVDHCVRAAYRAMTVLAYEEAARLFRMALRALDFDEEPDDAVRCDILLGLGDAQAGAGDAGAARETFVRAGEIARTRGMPDRLARAALGYGGRFVWARAGADVGLVPFLEGALAGLGHGHAELRARVLARLGGALRDDPDPARRVSLSDEALEIATTLDDPHVLGYVLDGRFAALWSPDTTEERLVIADRMLRQAERSGDLERAFQAHHYRMVCLLEMSDIGAARAELETKERISDELRQLWHRWYLAASGVMFAVLLGDGEAEERSVEALRLGEPVVPWDAAFAHRLQVFVLRRHQGRLHELEGTIRGSVRDYEVYPLLRGILALLLAETDRHDEAGTLLSTLVRDGTIALPWDNEWLFGATVLAEAAAAIGDEPRMQILYERVSPFSDRNVVAPVEVSTGSAARPLAVLAAKLRRWDEAERHFEEALETNRRMGARPWVAHTLLDQAAMLIERSGSGDRERALAALAPALETANGLGLAGLAGRAGELFRRLGAEPAGPDRRFRALMFTDVVDSTALVEAIGDDAWADLRRWHDRALRQLFRDHHGQEVDHAGDGFFVVFAEPDHAVRCAVAIQRRLEEHRRTHGFAPAVRIGVHAGEASAGPDGYSGKEVHLAARIGALAGRGEILVSERLAEGGSAPVSLRGRRTVTLKGITEPVTVMTVDWRP
jgi:class 3 adenylate cyclase